MTNPIVQSISDEQLAELEEYCHKRAFVCCGNFKSGAEYMSAREEVCCNEPVLTDVNINTPAEEILGLIARLRAAEADAKRYRWLCASAWYVGPEPCGDTEAVSWHDHNETMDGVTEAIDKAIAMERTP
ncbi:hypothetical protein VNPA152081_18090 [Pseudomonas aeruginosa]|uniref:hypothetical protein n=1 Tax=Pseudomonas aeruginosa TaxID=287 RepID=UPI0021E1BD24|nr:hypothetical protein [Pseudomonas aeruginosa]GLF57953.1 hypothetical protein VNPA141826_21110 [Pseudomonas aeruginosa]GLF76738.1 hypothetical protein VNPA152081_18090 [Pseudomonas aeruginosa]